MRVNPDCSSPTTSVTAAARTSTKLTRTNTSPFPSLSTEIRAASLNPRPRRPTWTPRYLTDGVAKNRDREEHHERREIESHAARADGWDHPADGPENRF